MWRPRPDLPGRLHRRQNPKAALPPSPPSGRPTSPKFSSKATGDGDLSSPEHGGEGADARGNSPELSQSERDVRATAETIFSQQQMRNITDILKYTIF